MHDTLDKETEGRQVPSVKTDNALSKVFRETVLLRGTAPVVRVRVEDYPLEPGVVEIKPVVVHGVTKEMRLSGQFEYGTVYGTMPPVKFSLKIATLDEEGNFTGYTSEPYTGFGVNQGGFLYADVTGKVGRESDSRLSLRWKKSYRGFDHPGASYAGIWDPKAGTLKGNWLLKDAATNFTGDGGFTLQTNR